VACATTGDMSGRGARGDRAASETLGAILGGLAGKAGPEELER
jgi:hypothetical protein